MIVQTGSYRMGEQKTQTNSEPHKDEELIKHTGSYSKRERQNNRWTKKKMKNQDRQTGSAYWIIKNIYIEDLHLRPVGWGSCISSRRLRGVPRQRRPRPRLFLWCFPTMSLLPFANFFSSLVVPGIFHFFRLWSCSLFGHLIILEQDPGLHNFLFRRSRIRYWYQNDSVPPLCV